MPCRSDYQEPHAQEIESVRVRTLLLECGFDIDPKRPYGDISSLHIDTAQLCGWCEIHSRRVSSMSLELQIWWRDHQKADKKREEQEQKQAREREAREKALSKLSAEEIRVLGIK